MINWSLFAKAISEYERLGYKLIEVPWLVDKQAIDVTLPPDATPFAVNGCGELNQLVGSAEQSFIYLALQGKLPPGKYQALTPCFRDDKEDEWHHKYFMKLELIEINHLSNKSWNPVMSSGQVIRDARIVLSQFTKKVIEDIDTELGADLIIDGIEIGSYGVRNYQDISWVYGTGLAEPRFSKVNGL